MFTSHRVKRLWSDLCNRPRSLHTEWSDLHVHFTQHKCVIKVVRVHFLQSKVIFREHPDPTPARSVPALGRTFFSLIKKWSRGHFHRVTWVVTCVVTWSRGHFYWSHAPFFEFIWRFPIAKSTIGRFSNRKCAEPSKCSKIAFPISKTIINRDTGRDTLWIWRDTDYQIVIQVVILCRFGVIQLFLK